MAEVVLERRPDEPQHEHVQTEVDHAVVQEGGRDQAPPLAVPDDRAEQHSLHPDPAALAVHGRSGRELEEVDAHVGADQREGDVRAVAVERPRRLAGGTLGSGLLAGDTRVVGAADPDRAEGHAVGADPAAAVRARHVRLAIGMAVAVQGLGHGGLAYPCAGSRRAHTGRGRPGPDGSRHRRDPRDVDDLPGARVGIRAGALRRGGRGGVRAPRRARGSARRRAPERARSRVRPRQLAARVPGGA